MLRIFILFLKIYLSFWKKILEFFLEKWKIFSRRAVIFLEFPSEIPKITDILVPWCLPVKTLLFDYVGKMGLAPGFFRFYIFFHYFLLKIVQKTAIWAGFLHPFSDPMSLSGPIEHICSMGPYFRFSTLFAKNLSPPKYLYIFISPKYFSWRRAAPSSPARA